MATVEKSFFWVVDDAKCHIFLVLMHSFFHVQIFPFSGLLIRALIYMQKVLIEFGVWPKYQTDFTKTMLL